MKDSEEQTGRTDRLAPSEAMSVPEFIPPPQPDDESIDEVIDDARGSDANNLFARRGRPGPAGDRRVDTQTSIERVREMVNQGSIKTRMVNISVFILMAVLGLALIAKAMSPAALEGGVKEGRTVVNEVLKQ